MVANYSPQEMPMKRNGPEVVQRNHSVSAQEQACQCLELQTSIDVQSRRESLLGPESAPYTIGSQIACYNSFLFGRYFKVPRAPVSLQEISTTSPDASLHRVHEWH